MGAMNFVVELNGKPVELSLARVGEELFAHIRNRKIPVRAERASGQSILTLDLDGKPHRLALLKNGTGYRVLSSGHAFDVRLERSAVNGLRKHLRLSGLASAAAQQIRSHMPGLIVKIEVEAGQRVAAGESLLVIEAMKMENEIRAPLDGFVEKIAVEPGMEVKGGQLLCIVKPATPGE